MSSRHCCVLIFPLRPLALNFQLRGSVPGTDAISDGSLK